MKKLLVTTIAAMATVSASASNFQLYGAIDTGLTYTHESGADTFVMNSGNYAGPRFGLRGTENFQNNLKVGFIIEAGYLSDTGAMKVNGTLFNRESQVYLTGDWGTFGAGRVAAFTSGSSSLAWFWDMDPFETAYNDAGIQATQQNHWVMRNNTIYYVTPVMNGFKAGLQYSLNDDAESEDARWSENNSFYNLALRWDDANARVVGGLETTQMQDGKADDKYSVKLAAACTPNNGPFTYYIGASWYKNYKNFSESTWNFNLPNEIQEDADKNGKVENAFDDSGKSLEGYSGYLGLKYTNGQTDYLALVQYLEGENKGALANAETDYSRYVGSVGIHHHFSNRTMLYAIGSYAYGEDLLKDNETISAHLGLTHFF